MNLAPAGDGGYDVTATLLSHEAFLGKNAPTAIRQAAWRFMFACAKQRKLAVHSVTAAVLYPTTDTYGNANSTKEYEATLDPANTAAVAMSSATDFLSVQWEQIVTTTFEAPAMQQQ